MVLNNLYCATVHMAYVSEKRKPYRLIRDFDVEEPMLYS